MNTFGTTVKTIRKRNGLTQRELGEVMTVSNGYISRVEHGKEKPTPMFIKLFCLLYSVDTKSFSN